jgi:alpha-beta hydrolase superfamily lysophospholipase
LLLVAGCSKTESANTWVEDAVTFVADGLTLHGTYRHQHGDPQGPAALLISESGRTDRNGDNNVAGPIGNMRQLAELLSDRGVASLRYDKVGTGKTGLGPFQNKPTDVVSAVYTSGAKAAVRFLAGRPATDAGRISVYALGEGTVHALALAADTTPGAPKIHSLGLFAPLPGRYLDIITNRVTADGSPATVATWRAAVDEIRTKGTVSDTLPDGLNSIVNRGNIKAVVEADKVDPVSLAAAVPAGTPVLLTCSDSDSQARCEAMKPLVEALRHTALTVVELKGVSHVLRDDPTDNIANYASQDPLSPQLVSALDGFVGK